MKRYLLRAITILLTVCMVFMIAGCGTEEEPPDIDKADLIGRWTRMIGGTDSETYAFFENGKCSRTYDSGGSKMTEYGTFEVSGNMLTITITDTKKTTEHKVSFKKEKTKMVWDKGTGLAEFMKE